MTGRVVLVTASLLISTRCVVPIRGAIGVCVQERVLRVHKSAVGRIEGLVSRLSTLLLKQCFNWH